MLNAGECAKALRQITSPTQSHYQLVTVVSSRINDQEHSYLTLRNGGVAWKLFVVARAGDNINGKTCTKITLLRNPSVKTVVHV